MTWPGNSQLPNSRARSAAKALGSGEWVYAIGGWSVDQFANTRKRFTRAELDRIVPGNPYLNVTDEELRRGLEVSWNNKGRPLRLASGS